MPDAAEWALIAHGGAKDIKPKDEKSNRAGLHEAIRIGSRILSDGGTALDAVEAVVKSLEADPAYNAGLVGCVKNEDGEVELDASIMDGATLDIGAIAGAQALAHPVMVARALLREREILLVGDGAMKFGRQKGFFPSKLPLPGAEAVGCDTVGCVARDARGSLAVATSTAGLEGTRAGRVGDVPMPGCGFYADNRRGAVSASGDGEAIARAMLASEFLHLLGSETPDEAAAQALACVSRVRGEAGLIAIAPDGRLGWAHTSSHFAVGMARSGVDPVVYLRKKEENGTI